MINRIKALLGAPPSMTPAARSHSFEEKHIAAAALLVEAACLDADFGAPERAAIRNIAAARFKLDEAEIGLLLELAEARQDNSNQLFRFTHEIKQGFAPEERVQIMEMLWEVAYADGVLHDYEANLLRRVGGLLYVSERDRGDARKRVMARLGIE